MSARIGAVIGLFFALVWLFVGALSLEGGLRIGAIVVGLVLLVIAAVRAWRRPAQPGQRFDRKWYLLAVAAELAAMWIAGNVLDRYGLTAYVWPVIGIIVGLHFIGLWRAADDRRFLWLAGGMTAMNLVALAMGPAMQLVSGLGSSVALMLAVAA